MADPKDQEREQAAREWSRYWWVEGAANFRESVQALTELLRTREEAAIQEGIEAAALGVYRLAAIAVNPLVKAELFNAETVVRALLAPDSTPEAK